MGIEYKPGIMPGQKIEIDARDYKKYNPENRKLTFEEYLPCLKDCLVKVAAESNRDFENFLDSDGRISLVGEDIEKDNFLMSAQEEAFSKEEGKDLVTWNRDREKNPGNLTEMALTIMLHKFLKEDFIVARASRYDDYNQGIDQVLVYKPTGEVVCGFDEVIGNIGDDGGSKKSAKLEKKMTGGGAHIKYGAKMEEGKLVRAEVRNVPAFYMSLSKDELRELLESIKNNPEDISATEKKIFSKLLGFLETQTSNLVLNENLKAKTESALSRLRGVLNKSDKTNNTIEVDDAVKTDDTIIDDTINTLAA